jgi:two-component system NtrC family sensor kinase
MSSTSAAATPAAPRAPGRPWWNRLSIRLALAIALVTLATVATLLFVVLRAQERHMVATVVQSTDLLSDTIRSSTYHDMLADRREDVYGMMQVVGQQDGVERVRIFNKEGRIMFSTNAAERNTFVDKRGESCYACHAADQPIVRPNLTSRVRTFNRNHHRVLAMVTPIYNDTSCSSAACHAHPSSQRVLGVVDMSVSLEGIDMQLRDLRRTTATVGTVAVVTFALALGVFVQRSVIRPILQLMSATRRIARGELTYRLPVQTRCELGDLQHSFNDMAGALARAREERLRLLDSLEQQVDARTAELKRAQQQLVRSEKLSSLGRLAASIAHEINNPLAGILTYSKLLIRSLDDPTGADPARASAVRQLQLVRRETERCTAIVRNLLDFARERPLDLKDVAIAHVLDDALMLVGNQARLANIELVKEFEPIPPVHADVGQLRQAFINLLINACDAMPGGGRLTVSTRLAAGTVEIAVADTGCGISKEHLSKVLDPFFTTKEKGTGLGLSVVYGIVERHGGSLDIASEVGTGTTVTVRLPTMPAAGGASGAGSLAEAGALPAAGAAGRSARDG